MSENMPLPCRTGAVSQEMLDAVPKKQFAFIGAIEAASQVLGFIGAAQLPGARPPVRQESVGACVDPAVGAEQLQLGQSSAQQLLCVSRTKGFYQGVVPMWQPSLGADTSLRASATCTCSCGRYDLSS